MDSYKCGLFAEYYVTFHLLLRGYSILARRYRTPVGEIDLITKKGRNVVVFEVKARRNIEVTTEIVSRKQWSRVKQAMNIFLAKNANYVDYNILFGIILYENLFKFRIFDGTE